MVKKGGAWKAAAGDEGEASKQKNSGWAKLVCTSTLLRPLEREGLIRPKDDKAWRLPGSESVLAPAGDERVAFVDHVHRGLSTLYSPLLP